ncbi:unnamed protein product [Blepharisma stoltei]|uniref:Protein kinase domain-containing protein n=1 Tax=Blepharisma stoltei TaxID=1481888 RepID=A0AAU9J2V4_9CILI|nr:unnamed protein product [Blepharisma stoltei]
MNPDRDYFCSFEEVNNLDDDNRRSLLISVMFTQYRPGSAYPQFAAAKIFIKRNERNEAEVNFLRQAGNCHPNVVKFYYDVDLPDQKYVIFMELCNKGSLADILYAKRHDPTTWTKDETLSMFIIITEALTSLHSAGIAHRDVKPHNIFVNQENEIRIGDFGESKEVRVGTKNTALGTHGYMSPFLERMLENGEIRSPHIDPYKEDVWSTGKTLYEIATMNLGAEIGRDNTKIRKKVLKNMRFFWYHDDAIEIILSMLTCDKNLRPSMAEVCARLKSLDINNFGIPGFNPYLIKPNKSSASTPTVAISGLGWRTTGTGGPSVTVSYEQPETISRIKWRTTGTVPETYEPPTVLYQPIDEIETEGCELCRCNEKFVHSCGLKTDINQFISYINEMVAINEQYNYVTCEECRGLFSIEIFQCRNNHFDRLPGGFFT